MPVISRSHLYTHTHTHTGRLRHKTSDNPGHMLPDVAFNLWSALSVPPPQHGTRDPRMCDGADVRWGGYRLSREALMEERARTYGQSGWFTEVSGVGVQCWHNFTPVLLPLRLFYNYSRRKAIDTCQWVRLYSTSVTTLRIQIRVTANSYNHVDLKWNSHYFS